MKFAQIFCEKPVGMGVRSDNRSLQEAHECEENQICVSLHTEEWVCRMLHSGGSHDREPPFRTTSKGNFASVVINLE